MNLDWLFQERNYRKALKKMVDQSVSSRGILSRWADHIGCHRSYLSQMMVGKTHLTKDQAWGTAEFFSLKGLHQAFFMNLVELERVVSPSYRKHLEEELKRIVRAHQDLAVKYDTSSSNEEEFSFYYSSWIPSAIHILTAIPEYQTPSSISRRLALQESLVTKILNSLEHFQLVQKDGKLWKFRGNSKFISKHSPFVNFHHQNWRQQASLSSQKGDVDSFHYTAVHAVSRNSVEELRALIFEFVQKADSVAGPSAAEELVAICLDVFEPHKA